MWNLGASPCQRFPFANFILAGHVKYTTKRGTANGWHNEANIGQQTLHPHCGGTIRAGDGDGSNRLRWNFNFGGDEATFTFWLVLWTPLKNISQLGWLFPIYGKIKHVPNHQPAFYLKMSTSGHIFRGPSFGLWSHRISERSENWVSPWDSLWLIIMFSTPKWP